MAIILGAIFMAIALVLFIAYHIVSAISNVIRAKRLHKEAIQREKIRLHLRAKQLQSANRVRYGDEIITIKN